MEEFLSGLVNSMEEVNKFYLDMRNWNEVLKMKSLKKRLDNVTK